MNPSLATEVFVDEHEIIPKKEFLLPFSSGVVDEGGWSFNTITHTNTPYQKEAIPLGLQRFDFYQYSFLTGPCANQRGDWLRPRDGK